MDIKASLKIHLCVLLSLFTVVRVRVYNISYNTYSLFLDFIFMSVICTNTFIV